MPAPTVLSNVASFLAQFPPFRYVEAEALERLAGRIEVKFYDQGEYLFREKEKPKKHFFVVHKGSIEIVQHSGSEHEAMVDLCDEGDVFGVRALLAGDDYISSARAHEEALVYLIPNEAFQPILEGFPKVALFFASGFAAGLPDRAEKYLEQVKDSLVDGYAGNEADYKIVPPTSKPKTASAETSVLEVAQVMTEFNIGSVIIVDGEEKPLGIITDADLRKRVVSKGLDASATPASEIMSAPVVTTVAGKTVSELVILMMRHRVRHFCITTDGTSDTKVTGIISERDILKTIGNNPTVILREIHKSEKAAQLRNLRDKAEELILQYLKQEVSMDYIAGIVTQINDALIEKAVRMALDELGSDVPPLAFCWLSLGSEGRKEQLLRTDQDNALLYADPAEDADKAAIKEGFLRLGEAVTRILNEAGFELCPADMMASNPQWCQSLSEWKATFARWMQTPDPQAVMNTAIFFDFRPAYGESKLSAELRSYVFDALDKHELYVSHLAANALQNPPPLSFFRKFIVEKGGEYAEKFDIKLRAMMPLADAARLLRYSLKVEAYGGTPERFRWAGEADEKIKALCEEAAMGYQILMRMRAIEGLTSHNSGRYINVEGLNKLQRQTLRNVFTTISKVQRMIKTRFRTDYFG